MAVPEHSAAPRHSRPPPAARTGVDPRRLRAANAAAAAFYRAQLGHAPGARAYLTGRGLGALVTRDRPWRVGYAPPGWDPLTTHLRALGFGGGELVLAGLSARTRGDPERLIDVFRDRIVFPIRDPDGRPVAFIGRASPGSLRARPELPKYLNSPETPIYTKGDLLYGLAEQRGRLTAGWTPVLVEGPVDALAVWLSHPGARRDGAAALAPCGTTFSRAQAAIIRGLPGAGRGVIVAFDGDCAGQVAAGRAFRRLRHPSPPGPLLAAEFHRGADPADLARLPRGHARLRAALRRARPLALAVADHRLDGILARHPRILDDIGGRHAAARALAGAMFGAAHRAEAAHLVQHIAARTGVGMSAVLAAAADRLEEFVAQLGDELGDEPDRRAAAGAPAGAPADGVNSPPERGSGLPSTDAYPRLHPGASPGRGSPAALAAGRQRGRDQRRRPDPAGPAGGQRSVVDHRGLP